MCNASSRSESNPRASLVLLLHKLAREPLLVIPDHRSKLMSSNGKRWRSTPVTFEGRSWTANPHLPPSFYPVYGYRSVYMSYLTGGDVEKGGVVHNRHSRYPKVSSKYTYSQPELSCIQGVQPLIRFFQKAKNPTPFFAFAFATLSYPIPTAFLRAQP